MILKDVVATVSTKNRSHTTLPLVLTSLLTLTYKPGKLVIYDDNDKFTNPAENEILKNLLQGLMGLGVAWFWLPGARKGQIHNHERARLNYEEEFIWRIDDDNVIEPNVLEQLYKFIKSDDKIGAVGPSILDYKNLKTYKIASNNIADIHLGMNVQWSYEKDRKIVPVDHLQGSTFLYRRAAAGHGYDLGLTRVAHREETLFTYGIKRNGWKLYALCGVNTYHMRSGSGGIRDFNIKELFDKDEDYFLKKLAEWGVDAKRFKVVHLNSGRGDHYAFKSILPELVEKYKDERIIVAACYKEVFWDITYPNVSVVDIGDISLIIDAEAHQIYRFMGMRKWKGTLAEAYKAMYL